MQWLWGADEMDRYMIVKGYTASIRDVEDEDQCQYWIVLWIYSKSGL